MLQAELVNLVPIILTVKHLVGEWRSIHDST